MIKAFFTTLIILLVCLLENIGHYFGFCFHGWMANIIGSISGIMMGLAVYSTDIQIWLKSRNYYGKGKPHVCKPHHHIIPVDLREGDEFIDDHHGKHIFDATRNWVKNTDDTNKKKDM
jgi:hypothetical protein